MAALLAVVAAFAFALGNAMQQRGALRTSAPGESSRFLLQLFCRPVWILGEALQIVGFVAQVVALAIGSLLVVQAIVVSSFVIALPCGVWLTDQRLGRREVLGALTTITGLILFLVGGHSTGSTNHATAPGWVLCLAVSVVVLAGLDLISRRVGAAPAAAVLGAAAGIAFGLQGGQVKALAHVGGGIVGIVTSWQLYALAVVGFAGFVYQQRGLKVGVLAPNLAASNVATLVASVVLGVALFAETLGRGAIGLALSVPGLVLMAAGILALARGGVATSVVPGVATAIEGAIEGAIEQGAAKVTEGKAPRAATFGAEATWAETSAVEAAEPGAAAPDWRPTHRPGCGASRDATNQSTTPLLARGPVTHKPVAWTSWVPRISSGLRPGCSQCDCAPKIRGKSTATGWERADGVVRLIPVGDGFVGSPPTDRRTDGLTDRPTHPPTD